MGTAEKDPKFAETSKHYTKYRVERYKDRARAIKEARLADEANNRNLAKRIEIAGYMPLRRDFDPEYDQDAEQLIADLEFEEDDTPIEKKLKQDMLEMYESRLQERLVRKNFVIDHCIQELDRVSLGKRPAKEKELLKQMIPFEKFFTMEEIDKLAKKVANIRELKSRINLLKTFDENSNFQKVENKLLASMKKRDSSDNRGKKVFTKQVTGADRSESDDPRKLLSPVEKLIVSRLGIEHSVYNQLRYSLAHECLKQGYVTHVVDPVTHVERFERTQPHQYTELFDFYAKLKPSEMMASQRQPGPRDGNNQGD